jgi:uncharacterized protein (TIGR02246 family)
VSAEEATRALYHDVLTQWNNRNAARYAQLFSEDATVIGFDGSEMHGRAEVESALGQIFAHHQTATYVARVVESRSITADIALIRAHVGMVPPGKSDLNPDVNAIQVLVAIQRDKRWEAELLQNTPAAFHGRPELKERFTEELRAQLR